MCLCVYFFDTTCSIYCGFCLLERSNETPHFSAHNSGQAFSSNASKQRSLLSDRRRPTALSLSKTPSVSIDWRLWSKIPVDESGIFQVDEVTFIWRSSVIFVRCSNQVTNLIFDIYHVAFSNSSFYHHLYESNPVL